MINSSLLTKGRVFVLGFTLAYILAFGAWFIAHGNYEFILYVATMLVGISVLTWTLHASQIPDRILWLLSIWGLLHMLGGGVHIGNHVLYAQILYPFYVDGDFSLLKYDQVVHAYGFGVAAAMFRGIILRYSPTLRLFGRIWLPALAALGLSVLNEIIEFAAVLALPGTWVGGYYNVSLDLVFNALGAFGVLLAIELFSRKKV